MENEIMHDFIKSTGHLVDAGLNDFCRSKPEAAERVMNLVNGAAADLKVEINLSQFRVKILLQVHSATEPVLITELNTFVEH